MAPRPALARNTVWATTASLVQLGATAVVLLLLTHEFAPEVLGRYIAVLGLVLFVSPFASLGAPSLVHKRLNADGMSDGDALALGRGMALVGGLIALLFAVIVATLLLPAGVGQLVVALGLAELVAIPYLDTAQAIAQAGERLDLTVIMKAGQGVFRLASFGLMITMLPTPSIEAWGWAYLLSAVVAAAVADRVARRHVGGVGQTVWPTLDDAREGVMLTLGWGTDRLRTDADKVLLLRSGLAGDAGIYGAASRLLQLAYVPIRGVIAASLASFWKGARSEGAPAALARRLRTAGVLYGVVAAVGFVLIAPFVPSVLGDGYAGAESMVQWLAPMPLIFAMQALAATALTASGHNRERVLLVLGATVANVVVNLIAIPAFGWRGAIGATIATELLLAGGLWVVLRHHEHRPAVSNLAVRS